MGTKVWQVNFLTLHTRASGHPILELIVQSIRVCADGGANGTSMTKATLKPQDLTPRSWGESQPCYTVTHHQVNFW